MRWYYTSGVSPATLDHRAAGNGTSPARQSTKRGEGAAPQLGCQVVVAIGATEDDNLCETISTTSPSMASGSPRSCARFAVESLGSAQPSTHSRKQTGLFRAAVGSAYLSPPGPD